MMITGAELFVKALKAEQVDTLFAYPGGQAIDLFNALYGEHDITVILPRHEQGLVHAADGYARSTGKVGVCLVTSGPGATNLVTGIATANYDSVPLVCFTGQVPTGLIGNDAFQEVDIVGITRSICKYAVTVRRRDELAAVIKKAFIIARTGKPGVVVVDLPKDIQREYGSDDYPEKIEIRGYKPKLSVHAGQIKKALETLNHAKKPVFLVGGGVGISHADSEMLKLAETTGVPVITTIMGKGAIPTTHDLYIGNIGIHGSYAANTAISRCDVLFSIGTRFNDRITGKIGHFATHAAIIHMDIDSASISRNIAVDIPIVADAKMAISALLEKAQKLNTGEWLDQWEKRGNFYEEYHSYSCQFYHPMLYLILIFLTFTMGRFCDKGGVSMSIYAKADELLHKSDFTGLLSKYGKVFFIGSYRTKLMTWNDLDFYIDASEFSPSQYYDLAGDIFKRMMPTRFDGFLNVEKMAAFFGFETDIYGERWNIDIWWKHLEEIKSALLSEDKLMQQLKERPECKKAILEIKQELARLQLYGFDKKQKHYHSREIYDSVLFGNVLSTEQFLLNRNKREMSV